MNILFTSVGRRVELLRAFRKAFVHLGVDGRISGTDVDALAPALQVIDRPHLVPTVDDPTYVDVLARVCQEDNIDLVYPLIDPDIPILADAAERLAETGAVIGVMSPQAVATITDKWTTYQFFRQLGIATPDSWLPGNVPASLSFPAFIKPRRGSAAEGTHRVSGRAELEFFSGQVEDPVIQEFIDGPEITTDVIASMDGEILAVVSRQRIAVRQGEVSKGVTVKDSDIRDQCLAIAEALQVRGPITVQCMLKEGRAVFTEVNARFAGGSPLAIAAGCDFPTLIVSSFLTRVGERPPVDAYEAGVYMTRCDESLFLRDEEVSRLESARLRS